MLPARPRRSGPAALLALAGVAAALGLGACGGDDDSVSQEELEQATEEAAEQAREEERENAELDELRERVDRLQRREGQGGEEQGRGDVIPPDEPAPSGNEPGIPADAENCGGGVYAEAGTTSCAFALNVAADFFSTPDYSFRTFSPATGETYSINCSGGSPVVCTGGQGAAVYIAVS